MRAAVVRAAATTGGGAALGACVLATAGAGRPQDLVPVALPLVWWLVGLLALAARPDHATARLLAAVGVLHLVGFALSCVVSVRSAAGWGDWTAAVLGNLAYLEGFAALAIVLATFPQPRVGWRPLPVALVVTVLAVAVLAALTSSRLALPLAVQRDSVPAPRPLPLGSLPLDLSPGVPLLVLGALAALLVRAVRARGEARRQLLWPATVAAVLAVLLLATPAATSLLGRGWAAVFIPVVAALPVALLAGLRRYRLLQVELYAVRTVSYAATFAVVVGAFAVAAALLGRRSPAVAVLVAALAAVAGRPLRDRLEAYVDKVVSGGRLRGQALVRHLAAALETLDPAGIAARTADAVATGLDVSWVEVTSGTTSARAGHPATGEPELVVPLAAHGAAVGAISCGPRRGGWSPEDVQLVELLGRHAGLALNGAQLARSLAQRVAELTASRERLLQAEDAARRRIERDLHDGIQQQIVALMGRLGLLRAQLPPESVQDGLAAASHELAQQVLDELRRLVRGIHPALLTDHGLAAAVRAQADLLTVPVTVDVDPRLEHSRFAPPVEAAAYFVVSEALANALKHSGSAQVRIVLSPLDPAGLQLAVVDQGRGFAPDADGEGSGLRGLRDRVEAVGGEVEVSSIPGVGTTVLARLPERVLAGA